MNEDLIDHKNRIIEIKIQNNNCECQRRIAMIIADILSRDDPNEDNNEKSS